MKLEIPKPSTRAGSNYAAQVAKGYGDPRGTIALDENWELTLDDVSPEDCDGLIRAAAEIKQKVLAYRAELAVPHGTKHLYKGRCQLCGKPEGDELHAEPEPAACGARPYPAGSEGDDGTECALPAGDDGAHADEAAASVTA